ncbi:helix-turn-helix transcriptional regulator [Shewanella chilikensis]|uniref:helix-turn-helix transcriptional regulator n=1 Tax=Shewanella chilikensis TaxID=558541 RepID=UPI003A987AAA
MTDLTSASSLSSLQDECLKLLMGMFDIPKAASYMVDTHRNMCCPKHYSVHPGMQREYIEKLQGYDPLHPKNLADQSVTVQRANALLPLSERMQNPYLSDFMNRWDISDTVELYLHSEGKIVAGFSLFLREDLLLSDMKKLESLHGFMQFSFDTILSSPKQRDFDNICELYQLTKKEKMVVEQVLDGLPNKSIANNLSCSLSTIKTHLQHIFEKMEVNSKAEVTRLVYVQKPQHH